MKQKSRRLEATYKYSKIKTKKSKKIIKPQKLQKKAVRKAEDKYLHILIKVQVGEEECTTIK